MPTSLARQKLDKLVSGTDLDEADLRALVAQAPEDLNVDFKDGAELAESKKAARTVRQYVSAFANADGGLLVVGVSDGPPGTRVFTPTPLPGGQPLSEWAARVLAPLAGYFSPGPRLQATRIDGCDILVVAVTRAPSLVPCYEDGELRYYLRLGESTLLVPSYLMSDLVLGRRSHPSLLLEPVDGGPALNGAGEVGRCLLTFRFNAENAGMVPATDVIVGVATWAYKPRDPQQGRLAPDHIRGYIDARPVPPLAPSAEPLVLVHSISRIRQEVVDMPAFDLGRPFSVGAFLVPRAAAAVSVRSAAYILSKGHPPDWYQFDWCAPPQRGTALNVRLTRTFAARPIVAWDSPWT